MDQEIQTGLAMRIRLLPFLLLIVPLMEIAVFIAIGGEIGIVWTLVLIFVTAIIGSFLLRQQGFQLFQRIQSEMAAGQMPGKALAESGMVLAAGILLLTPGFVTDTIGFLLFVPGIRHAIWSVFASKIVFQTFGQGHNHGQGHSHGHGHARPTASDEKIVDLDEDDYTNTTPNPDTPWKR